MSSELSDNINNSDDADIDQEEIYKTWVYDCMKLMVEIAHLQNIRDDIEYQLNEPILVDQQDLTENEE